MQDTGNGRGRPRPALPQAMGAPLRAETWLSRCVSSRPARLTNRASRWIFPLRLTYICTEAGPPRCNEFLEEPEHAPNPIITAL